MSDRVLLVLARDDHLATMLRRLLAAEGFTVRTGHHVDGGPSQRHAQEEITAVLVDAGLIADDPAVGLDRLRTRSPGALLLVMAGRPEHPALVAAVREGALPLTADFDYDELVQLLGGDGGLSGVREPRRPHPPVGSAAVTLQPPVR